MSTSRRLGARLAGAFVALAVVGVAACSLGPKQDDPLSSGIDSSVPGDATLGDDTGFGSTDTSVSGDTGKSGGDAAGPADDCDGGEVGDGGCAHPDAGDVGDGGDADA